MTRRRDNSLPRTSDLNSGAGLVFESLPQTAPYRELAEFYDDFYDDETYQTGARTIARETSRYVGSGRLKLLDVGAGTGRMARFLSAYFDVDSLEPEPAMLCQLSHWSPDSTPINKHLEDLPGSETYDIVTALGGVVAHLRTATQLRMWCRALTLHLKRGGVAFIDPWHTPASASEIAGRPLAKPGWGPRYASRQRRVGCRFNVLSVDGKQTFTRYYYIIHELQSKRTMCFTHITQLTLFHPEEMLNALSLAGFSKVGTVRATAEQTIPSGFRALYYGVRAR